MDEIFQIIQKDIIELENSLAYQIPFFKNQGNVYLVGDNQRKNEVLLEEYIKFCKLNLNHEDLNKLKSIAQGYRRTLIILATKMEIPWQQDTSFVKLVSNNPVDYSGINVIAKFAELKQKTQALLTELNSYLINSFSLKLIPPATVQNSIAQRLKDFDFNADDIDVYIDMDGLKTAGAPDLKKISQAEIQSNKFKILISANAEVLDVYRLFEQYFKDDLEDDLVGDIITAALEKVYTEVYKFIYEQIFINKLNTQTVLKNTHQKYGSIKDFFIKSFQEITEITKKDLSAAIDYDIESKTKEFMKGYKRLVSEDQMFADQRAKIYNLQIREANEFESNLYNSRVCFDCYLMPEAELGVNILVATLALVWAPRVYELSAILICGADYNKPWGEKVASQIGMGEIERLVDDEELASQAQQAIKGYEKYLTENL